MKSAAELSAAVTVDATWDRFVAAHPAAHFLQTSGWGALKARFGWQPARVALSGRPGAPAAGAQVLYRSVAGLRLAYVPRGPLVDWCDEQAVAAALAAVEERSRADGASVLMVEPELTDGLHARRLLAGLGYAPSPRTVQPPSTIVLDLPADDAALLAAMKPKWRYNIRLAERKGVRVRPAAPQDLPAILDLMDETGRRDGFSVHSREYYATAYKLFAPHTAAFLLAEYEGAPLAALVAFQIGDTAWYVWGASGSAERNRMPNHALQWEAMRWARARGARRYDLWGIPDDIGRLALGLRQGMGRGVSPDELPVDLERLPAGELWGVYRFKQGFGGEVVRTVGAWEKPLAALGYKLYRLGLAAQEAKQRLAAPTARRTDEPAALHAAPVTDAGEWRRVLAGLPMPHVLQSWEWGELKAQTGWRAERLRVTDRSGQIVAAFQLLLRRPVANAPLHVAYVPKGPLVDWSEAARAEAVLALVEAHARRRGALFVKVDPDVDESGEAGKLLLHTFFRRGWRYSREQVQYKNTGWTEMAGDEALLAGMKPKWRYNIRLAERRGIEVRQGAAADLPAFYALYAETGARDGFLIRPYGYYRAIWERFLTAQAESDNPAGGALLLAEHPEEETPVAGLFLFKYGDRAWYFYGASSERRRRDMPNYLLQWEAMRWAHRQGCTLYDWWGAPSEPDDHTDGMHGVWQFKQGFGAELRRHVGAWDFPVQPTAYSLYTEAAPRLLALLRRLRR